MTFIAQLTEQARNLKAKIVLPESHDERILQAAEILTQQGIAEVILINHPNLSAQTQQLNLDLSACQILALPSLSQANRALLTSTLKEQKKFVNLSDEALLQALENPLLLAATLVKSGLADGCVAGAANATGDVIRAALQAIGLAENSDLISSYFVMLLEQPHHQNTELALTSPVLFADCAINIAPTSAQLATIAQQTAHSAQQLLDKKPRVAMLSFSTNGSAKHETVSKVADAATWLQENAAVEVVGDIQFDAAVSLAVQQSKLPADKISDQPFSVFVFPSLEAGNIGYKIAERLGGAETVGPIIQGLAKPMNDLSRGCDVTAIINTVVLTAIQTKTG
jgi:phosphate acetyltransferase